MSKLLKTRRGRFVRLHVWGAFWEYKDSVTGKMRDEYEFPQICLTRKEARHAAGHTHVYQGKARRVWVEWEAR